MDGVILFADDFVFNNENFESKLFHKMNEEGFPVLPIGNLPDLENTIKSISTFKAIILDWEFIETLESNSTKKNPLDILKRYKIYSLIFIYSYTTIGTDTQAELKIIFGNKIQFLEKIKEDNQIEVECGKIFKLIEEFETSNKHLETPFIWGQAINISVQSIFNELEKADKYWIKEIYYSSVRKYDKATGEAKEVEVEPTFEVINLFQNLLSEKLIQNADLLNSISKYSQENFKQELNEQAIKDLYSRLYYTTTLPTDTVMTGDIYELDTNIYGVIISPECDMNKLIKRNEDIEMLCFTKNDFIKIKDFCNTDDEIKRAYNQEIAAIHLLPIFSFTDTELKTALIDFRFCLKFAKGEFLNSNKEKRKFKINPPYIQQLRQRYLAYVGRIGVPTIPASLRILN